MRAAVTILVFCVAGLLALGLVMLYSSSMAVVGAKYLILQLVYGGLGLVLCAVAAVVDYRLLKKVAWPLFIASVVVLLAVLVPGIGFKINGARRWIHFGSFRFQPSELAKVAMMVAIAWYGDRFQRQMPNFKRGILYPAPAVGLMLALIFVEPDRGTTVLLACVAAIMFLIAGVRWALIIPPGLACVGFLAYSLRHDTMRTGRIAGWLDMAKHKDDVSYQAYQAMLALGAGGWTGVGLGNSRQKLGFIPENHTDFILSIIGEELGLVVTLLVVAAFIAIIVCGIYIALKAADTFGLLLGAGITFLIGLQAFINIGVVTSALPNKGLPLPFISYGGSSLLAMLVCVGLLLSIARRSPAPEAVPELGNSDEDELGPDNPFRGPKPATA